MTPTSTSTSVHVRTRTATFLSELVMGTIGDILAELGIDLMRLYSNWAQDQAAIKAWIEEGSLEMVIMECHRPDGVVKPIFEFPINYEAGGSADKAFVESRASMARYRAKLDSVPADTSFRLFCAYNGPHSEQPGWSPGRRSSTAGLDALSFGTLGRGPDGGVSLRYLR